MPQILVNQNEYLSHAFHSGGGRTKGSKNGVRRWQNPDGTLTEAGKIHYGQMYGWGKDTQDVGTITKQGRSVVKSAVDTPNSMYKDYQRKKIKNQYREEAKSMSDDELKKITKRLELEDKYVSKMTPEQIESGADKALKALEVVGAVATTAIAVGKVAEMVSSHYITKDKRIRGVD